MTNHERFVKVFRGRKGRLITTAEIRRLMLEEYPELPLGSILPSDHGDGNKTPCRCSRTDRQIFERVTYGQYRVRDFKIDCN